MALAWAFCRRLYISCTVGLLKWMVGNTTISVSPDFLVTGVTLRSLVSHSLSTEAMPTKLHSIVRWYHPSSSAGVTSTSTVIPGISGTSYRIADLLGLFWFLYKQYHDLMEIVNHSGNSICFWNFRHFLYTGHRHPSSPGFVQTPV